MGVAAFVMNAAIAVFFVNAVKKNVAIDGVFCSVV